MEVFLHGASRNNFKILLDPVRGFAKVGVALFRGISSAGRAHGWQP